MMKFCVPMRVFFSILILVICIFCNSSNSSAIENDAIILEFDQNRDYCSEAWQKIKSKTPEKFKGFSLDFRGKVGLNPEILFKYTCNECRQYLEGKAVELQQEFTKQTDVQAKALNAWEKAKADLRKEFYIWVAENARPYILEGLSEKDQKKFATDSKFMQSKAIEYLDGEKELKAYVNAYIKENAPLFFSAQKAYFDVMQGQSAAIIKDLNTLITSAQEKVKKMNGLADDVAKSPETPYGDLLKKNGLKGDWVDNFKEYEGKFREMDENFKIVNLITIIHKSSSSDLPRHKVEAMFDFLDTVSGLAANSKIPIASLMAGFIQDLVKVGKEALSATVKLGKDIEKRAGYCIGAGAATEDPRSDLVAKKQLTLCPIAYERKPWNDIFVEIDSVTDRIHFWDQKNEEFIEGKLDGGGKPVIQRIYKFISLARSMGYSLDGSISMVAGIYNTPYKGGFRGIESRAAKVMAELQVKAEAYEQIKNNALDCNTNQLNGQLEKLFGFNFDNFLRDVEKHGIEKLQTTYIAAYLAEKGLLGKKGSKRSIAMFNYDRALERLRDFRFVHVAGQVLNENNPEVACNECADATLDIKIIGGQEVRGCESWKTNSKGSFNIYIATKWEDVSIFLKASASDKSSEIIELAGNRPLIHTNVFIPFGPSKVDPGPDKESIILPNLVGMPSQQAMDTIKKLGLTIGPDETGSPAANSIQVGRVESTTPSPGTKIVRGSQVILQIFDDVAISATVPNVLNLPRSSALNKLKNLGLKVQIINGDESIDSNKVGRVYSQTPDAGTEFIPGTKVTITVYTQGQLMGAVPNVKGQTLKKGIAAIRQMGLEPKIELGDETSNAANANKIYKQEPIAGNSLTPGSPVTVWVYDYNDPNTPVPQVVGMSLQSATKTLKSSGFKARFELGPETSQSSKEGVVYQQFPAAGKNSKPGSQVVLTLYDYVADEFTVPDVIGMGSSSGISALKSKGFKVVRHKPSRVAKSKSDENKIYKQLPKAGAIVNSGEVVEVWYYRAYQQPLPEPVIPSSGGVPYIDIPEIAGYTIIEMVDYLGYETRVKAGKFYPPSSGFPYKFAGRYFNLGYEGKDHQNKWRYISFNFVWLEHEDKNSSDEYSDFCKKLRPHKVSIVNTDQDMWSDYESPSKQFYASLRTYKHGDIGISSTKLKIVFQNLIDQVEPYAKSCK